ncbi:MAG TPA: hypothetical protein PKV72_06965 [Candidatus Peribacteria bacterium]|nr:hypothetical protein [Candidatus Peribacteria bacterium]
MFQPSYIVTVPAIVFVAFALLYIPSMMVSGSKPDLVGKAIACYLMKTFGMLLMAVSMLPLLYNIISNTLPPMSTVSGLLMVFLFGVGIVVHYSTSVDMIDESSVVVVRTVFAHGFEVLGAIIALLSVLSLLLTFMLTQTVDGWEMPATSLVFGLLITLMFSVHINTKNASRRASKKK